MSAWIEFVTKTHADIKKKKRKCKIQRYFDTLWKNLEI